MSITPNCLTNAIGFAPEECECVADYISDYSISYSGLYMSELPGMALRILDSLGGCPYLWEKMTRARENAINTFKIDVISEIEKYKEPIRSYFSGDIGYKTFTTTLAKDTYHGLRMYSDVKGGSFFLRGVSLLLNTSEAVNLEIYDEYDLLYTYPLTSLAGRPHRTDITPALELSLDRNYYFLVQSAGLPYNNKLSCGCGGYKWCFCEESPCYKKSRDRWTEWAMVAGVTGNVLADRDHWGCTKNAMGMQLHGNFRCSMHDILCDEDTDWVNDPIAQAIANSINYKSGEFLTNYILDTNEVNRYSLLGSEGLNENRIFYNKRYAVMIDYIAQTIEDDRNDCYRCRAPMGIRKRTHLI